MRKVPNIFDIENKVIVITGGAGILGSRIARGMAQFGARVALCDIKDASSVAKTMKAENLDVEGYYIDVLNPDKIRDCHEKIMRTYGKVDVLINAAGGNIKEATVSEDRSFFEIPLNALEKVVSLNLFGGAILPSQVFGKSMVSNPQGGSIINISSMNAFRPLTRIAGYSAAKAAVSNFTQWLAVHFAREYNRNLRVNAIAPGFFLTTQNKYLLLDESGNLTPRGESIITHTPMGRFGDPDELIGVCVWLSSEASKFVTGVVLPVDGGFNAYSGV